MIRDLLSILESSIDFYEYQLMRYWNDTSIDLRGNWEWQWRNIGFDVPSDTDLLRSAYTNVIKSVIDTLVSKLAEQKVRPYFNPINGLYKTKKVVKDVQQYFDILYDNQSVHDKISDAFRQGCIFGKGHIFVDPYTYEISNLAPHCLAVLNSEERYGKPTEALIRYLNYPSTLLKKYKLSSTNTKVDFMMYFNLNDHKVRYYVNNALMRTDEYKHDVLPFITIYFNPPVFGNNTVSIVQELDGIQTQIDYINSQISAATQLTPANQTFVLEGSSLTPKDLSNKAGTVYGIKMPPGVNAPPVVSVQPRMFDPQWKELIEYYIKQAYEQIGVSQLSSMSKKPSGLDSGVALTTMEDIESDRFQTQVNHYIKSYIDLARLIIEVVDEDEDILPKSLNTTKLKWKDVKKQSDLFKIQYSAASSLSKDPSEKLKQVMQLTQSGIITPDKVARYLDMPDLESAYSEASSVADGVSQCIANAIENHDYEIPEWVSYQKLAQEITVMQNELYSSLSGEEKNDKEAEDALKSLSELEERLANLLDENGYVDLSGEQMQSESGISAQQMKVPDITSQPNNQLANPEEAANPDVITEESDEVVEEPVQQQ